MEKGARRSVEKLSGVAMKKSVRGGVENGSDRGAVHNGDGEVRWGGRAAEWVVGARGCAHT